MAASFEGVCGEGTILPCLTFGAVDDVAACDGNVIRVEHKIFLRLKVAFGLA